MLICNPSLVLEKARFTLLAPGLIRLEFDEDSAFEDRPSLRALKRPSPLAFEQVEIGDSCEIGLPGGWSLHYRPDGLPFSAANLDLCLDGTRIWQPGQEDAQNLGGAHLAMDCIQRGFIPQGVHSATTQDHENGSRWHLWSYIFGPEGATVPDAHYAGGLITLEQLLATRPVEGLPENIKALLRERSKYPPGLLSRAGYFLLNDTATPILDPVSGWLTPRSGSRTQDFYLLFYENNFAGALRDYAVLCGLPPLVPRYSLGLWYSRYPTYAEPVLRSLLEEFAQHQLPLDVLVLDLEWHQRGWYGYDWDLGQFPDPDGFLQHLADKKVRVTLNIHPTGVPVEDSRFAAFLKDAGIDRETITVNPEWPMFTDIDFSDQRQAESFLQNLLAPVEKQGVDFWWIDGDVPCQPANVDNQLWTNHIYQRHAAKNTVGRRPMIFSRSAGLGSHRYPFHFTGDTYAHWEVLRSQVEYTLRAGHIGLSHVTHDIGGHMSEHPMLDGELYCRWLQFGVMSPMVRLHSSTGGERLPWRYGEKAMESARACLRWRMELLPYLYTLCRETYETCLPLCRSNPLAFPDWEEGYSIWDSYSLGGQLYCTPVVSPGGYRQILLPPGLWFDPRGKKWIESDGHTPLVQLSAISEPPLHFIKEGSILIKQPYATRACQLPESLIIEIYGDPATARSIRLYEDNGISTNHEVGNFAWTTFRTVGGESLQISSPEGSYPEHPATRSYEVRLFSGEEGGEPRISRATSLATDEARKIPFA